MISAGNWELKVSLKSGWTFGTLVEIGSRITCTIMPLRIIMFVYRLDYVFLVPLFVRLLDTS
jgi:hypothetical protein